MPPVEQSFCYEDAILLVKNGYDRYGRPKVDDPTEIKCRWITCRKDRLDAQGNPVVVEVEMVTTTALTVGSQVWYGSLEDWVESGSGGYDSEMMEVFYVEITKDVKQRATRYTADLIKYRDQPNRG